MSEIHKFYVSEDLLVM